MNNSKKINWGEMASYLDRQMDREEQEKYEQIHQNDADHHKIIASVQEIWNNTKMKPDMIEFNTDSAWAKLKDRIEKEGSGELHEKPAHMPVTRKFIYDALRVAALIVLIAGIGYVVMKAFILPVNQTGNQLTARSEKDRMMQTILPDGSVVYIKAGSKVSYTQNKIGPRELILQGEAFFEIAHDRARPFIISTEQALIEVIGTTFSVQSDEKNHLLNVLVESGMVSLRNKSRQDQSIVIESGYMGILTDNSIRKEINRNENWLSWKTGKLEFRETTLDKVIKDLNHTYNTSIKFGDNNLTGCHFTGTFLNHQPVDTVLEVLKTAFNLDIESSRSEIILRGAGCGHQ